MGATMVLAPSLRQAIVPAHLMGRVASTSRMLAMCAAPVGAFLGGWLATTYDIRTPLYAAGRPPPGDDGRHGVHDQQPPGRSRAACRRPGRRSGSPGVQGSRPGECTPRVM